MTICPTCATQLEQDAVFCGNCGARVRSRRRTLVGAELDGRFHVDAKIAEGGFGSIYRATHLASGQVVALKVLHGELASDRSLAARFRREGEALSSLRSPHTVSVFEIGEAGDGTLYIAMELLHGESLLDRFRTRGPLPWRDVLGIMKSVCRSLDEAHALGIIHRDLKPANIHLEANDHVKVLDFGIAKLLRGSDIDDGDDLTRIGQAVGTLEYMAPEQLIGGACDARADVYGLGVTVYEMITGRRPYEEATGPTSLIAAVMTQPLIPPSTLYDCGCIPAEADELVLRCLAKDPKDRFASVAEVVAAIDAILAPADDEATWIDHVPVATITPRSQAALAFGPTHMQAVVVSPATNPGVVIAPAREPSGPVRALARGSTSPVRARRESDLDLEAEMPPPNYRLSPVPFHELTPPFSVADGSRVGRPVLVDQPVLVERRAAPPPAAVVRPLGTLRVALWTLGLLAGGAALGMLIASLIG